MNRSTAGVTLDSPCSWLMTVAGAGYRAGVVATAAQVARAAGRTDLRAASGVVALARASRQQRQDVSRHLAGLVADGFLDAGSRGRGWGVRTSYTLTLPALYRRSEVPEMGTDRDRSLGEMGTDRDRSLGEMGTDRDRSLGEMGTDRDRSWRASPLLGVVSTNYVSGGGGEASPTQAFARALTVLDGLPEELLPRDDSQLAEMAADVLGWLDAGWSAEGITDRARAKLRPGAIAFPPAILRRLIPARPPAAARPTPVPDQYVAAPGERMSVDQVAARVAMLRAAKQRGAS